MPDSGVVSEKVATMTLLGSKGPQRTNLLPMDVAESAIFHTRDCCCRGNCYSHYRHPEHERFEALMIALYAISIGVAWLVNSTRERGAGAV